MSNARITAAAAAGFTAICIGLSGCSSAAQNNTAAGSSAPAGTASGAASASGSGSAAAGSSGSSAGGATANVALSDWVASIIEGDYEKACLDMAAPAGGATSGPLVPATAAMCSSTATGAAGDPSPVAELRDWHASFTPKDLAGATPSVSVTAAAPTGSSVTVHADQIMINGKTLSQVVISNSTGLTAANLDIDFEVSKVSGAWYIGNVNLNI